MKRKDRIKKKFGDKRFKTKQQSAVVNESKPKKESKSFYYRNYKALLFIPFIILFAAILLIVIQTVQTGEFINKGITIKGGTAVEIPSQTLVAEELELKLEQKFPDNEILVRTNQGAGQQVSIEVQANILPEETALSKSFKEEIVDLTGIPENEMTIQEIGSRFGASFFQAMLIAILIAFVFMGLVVFLYFRTFVPSAAVILSAFSDIVVTVAIINILDFKVGVAGIAALLMLVGYSVDTDILLTTRVLKNKEGSVYERIINSMKTGLTMSMTTIAAVGVTFLVAQSEVLKEIMIIILIGLVVDIVNTWIQNAGILRYYAEKKEREEA